MLTTARLIAEIQRMRAEASASGARNPKFDRPLEFQYGVVHGQDLAYEEVLERIAELVSEEENEEQEDE